MALRPNCEGADLPLLVSNSLDHLCAPEPGFSETAIPPGAAHYGRNGFAGSARSLGDAQTIEIGTLALDNDVGFAFAKSGQSRVLFRDWSVGSVVAKQIWNPSSVTAQEPPGYSRPKPSICFGFVLRSVGERGAPLMQPIRPERLATSKADSSASAAAGAAGLPVDAILLFSSRARRRIWSGDKAMPLKGARLLAGRDGGVGQVRLGGELLVQGLAALAPQVGLGSAMIHLTGAALSLFW